MEDGPSLFSIPDELPLVPLRELVVFPYMVMPLFVARERSIAAVEEAMAGDRLLLLVAQRDAEIEDPEPDDLYRVYDVIHCDSPLSVIPALPETGFGGKVKRTDKKPQLKEAEL